MITRHTWSNGACCFTVDSEELAEWWRTHGTGLKEQLEAKAAFTARDNYGMGGKKSGHRKNQFEIGRSVERAVGA